MFWLSRFSLALAIAVLLGACGSTGATSTAPQSFTIAAKEYAFEPVQLSVTAGQPVELTFRNTGSQEHDWSVNAIDLAGKPVVSETKSDDHSMGHMEDTPKLHVVAGAAGLGKIAFTPTKAGTYEYFCTVAGHKQAGMVGKLTVNAQ